MNNLGEMIMDTVDISNKYEVHIPSMMMPCACSLYAGAAVIKKNRKYMMERVGMTEEEIDKYLEFTEKIYNTIKEDGYC